MRPVPAGQVNNRNYLSRRVVNVLHRDRFLNRRVDNRLNDVRRVPSNVNGVNDRLANVVPLNLRTRYCRELSTRRAPCPVR